MAHDGVLPTQVYGRSNANILRSTDDGGSYGGITPPWLPAESDVYLAAVATDPGAAGTVYASSNQNLWQSTDGGATWPNSVPISDIATEVDVAPNNGNNVVVAIGGRVFVSTDALVPGGLTLTDITRNLPGRFVGGVAFDPNDPATIYAVLGGFSGAPGGHVFRTSLTAAGWTDISPPLDLPFNAIALDGSDTPYRPLHRHGLRRAAIRGRRRELERARRHPFPRRTGVRTGVSPWRAAGRDVRPRRLLVRQADRPVDRRQSRERPAVRHRLPGPGVT